MAKTLTLEAALQKVRELRARAVETLTEADVLPVLECKHSAAVAGAAELVGKARMGGVTRELVAAFDRFLADGAKTDKGCVAKLAIANALCDLDFRDGDVYARGVKCVQKEASWGAPKDTAGELRGRCAEALMGCLWPGALVEVAALLVDEEGQARVGAVRAAASSPGEGGAALLRLKLAMGDEEPVVMGEVCAGLLRSDADRHDEVVADFLAGEGEEECEIIVGVLAEGKSPAVLKVLRRVYERAGTREARMGVLEPIARLRVDGAEEFLLGLVEKELHPRAREVVECLGPKRDDERFRGKLKGVLEKRDDEFLTKIAKGVMEAGGRGSL